METLHIELFQFGKWYQAAQLTVQDPSAGLAGTAEFEYLREFAERFYGFPEPGLRVGCNYDIDFFPLTESPWPAFLLDLIPAGAGRRKILERMQLKDGRAADWELLKHAVNSPPGNLRVSTSIRDTDNLHAPDRHGALHTIAQHPGFPVEDILAHQEHFIEYAHQNGAVTGSASEVHGEAPKYLLVQDQSGQWHAEGALPDEQVAKHWLVKFPRGNTQSDRKVVRNEAAYLEVARDLTLNVGEPLQLQGDSALFVPRFDRVVHRHGIKRYGLESLCSAAGIAQYGASPRHDLMVRTLYLHSTQPVEDIAEYVARDVVNIVLGNKDNHARNTALIKREDAITLSPVFDLAPMYLDKAGIARVCRWEQDKEKGGQPEWAKVVEWLGRYDTRVYEHTKQRLQQLGKELLRLENSMQRHGCDLDVIERCLKSAKTQQTQLSEL